MLMIVGIEMSTSGLTALKNLARAMGDAIDRSTPSGTNLTPSGKVIPAPGPLKRYKTYKSLTPKFQNPLTRAAVRFVNAPPSKPQIKIAIDL
jgi:hypothetical protein